MKKLILSQILSISLISLFSSQNSYSLVEDESGTPSYELSCRAKAKEVAADTYKTCVTDGKTAEIEKLRKDYQERLKGLKEDYEKEIEKLGGKPTRSTKKSESTGKIARTKSSKKGPSMTSNHNDMTVEVKVASPSQTMTDDSQMDLPEPIPVENISN